MIFGFFKKIPVKPVAQATGAGLVLAVGLVAGFEGLETKPYQDIGGILTYCYGETEGAIINAEYTPKQCRTLLENRVQEFNDAAREMITVDMPPKREAAVTSWLYNVGIAAGKKSTLVRKMNAGDTLGACRELDRWVYVGRTYIRGLANRRAMEKELCLDGLLEET